MTAGSPPHVDLAGRVGNIDIYWLDQILKGRIPPTARILDAGCGGGRNLVWLLRTGHDVHGVDASEEAIASVRQTASSLVAGLMPDDRFRVASARALPFEDESFDVVLAVALLHFCESDQAFDEMLREMARVLRPGGLFFARLASNIGIEDRVRPIEGRIHELPDGSTRYLVDEELLLTRTSSFPAELIEPIKTTVVQGMRSMTTWVCCKR